MRRAYISSVLKHVCRQKFTSNNIHTSTFNRETISEIITNSFGDIKASQLRNRPPRFQSYSTNQLVTGAYAFSTNVSEPSTTQNTESTKHVDENENSLSHHEVEKDDQENDIADLSDEEKMRNKLKQAHRKMSPVSAAKILIELANEFPPKVIGPVFQEANQKYNIENKNLSNAHKLNVLDLMDPETKQKDDAASNDEAVNENDRDIVNSIFNVLRSLSSAKIGTVNIATMVSVLKMAASKLKLDEHNCFAVKNIENSLTWQSRNSTMSELTMLLSYSFKRKNITGDKVAITLFEETVKNIERRWVEVVNPKEFVGFMHYYPQYLSEQFIRKVEDRITDSVENMEGEDLALVLKMLGTKKRRHLPLLRALSYHLLKKRTDLSVKLLTDCLFACNQLSFKDVNLLDGLCDLAEQKFTISDVGELSEITQEQQILLARSILTSLGQMKYLHKGLLDSLATLMTSKLNDGGNINETALQSKDLAAFLLATATLNYCPKNSEKLYEAVIQTLTPHDLEKDAPGKAEVKWLNIVWSMVILNKAPHNWLESVLSSEFYNRLLYSHDHRNVQVILRLLNVNATASIDPTYKGPTINVTDDPLLKDVKSALSKDKLAFVERAMEDFSKFAAPPRCLVPNINTLMGFQIQGEAVFDKNNKALPIEELSILDVGSSTDKSPKPLPEGATRLAVFCVGYHDCLADGTTLSGATSLCLRLLESKVKVFTIMHNYSQPRQKVIERVTMLDSKLKKFLTPIQKNE